jgi:hypothetical protein
MSRRSFFAVSVTIALVFAIKTPAQQAGLDPSLYSGLHWRMIGPFRGGRVDAVSGVPGRPYEFYFGHVNGGVWKTINAGRTWLPVFDGQPVASIGALAVADANPDIVYVGTGESTLRDSNGYGNGVYKTTDAGKTWTHAGLDLTHHIGRIAIDPKNAAVAYVAAIGDRRGRCRDRSDQFAHRLCEPLGHSSYAVVHLRAVEQPRRRDLQVDRRRRNLDAVDQRIAGRRSRPQRPGDRTK